MDTFVYKIFWIQRFEISCLSRTYISQMHFIHASRVYLSLSNDISHHSKTLKPSTSHCPYIPNVSKSSTFSITIFDIIKPITPPNSTTIREIRRKHTPYTLTHTYIYTLLLSNVHTIEEEIESRIYSTSTVCPRSPRVFRSSNLPSSPTPVKISRNADIFNERGSLKFHGRCGGWWSEDAR